MQVSVSILNMTSANNGDKKNLSNALNTRSENFKVEPRVQQSRKRKFEDTESQPRRNSFHEKVLNNSINGSLSQPHNASFPDLRTGPSHKNLANNRLKMLRSKLAEKKGEIVKPHSLIPEITNKAQSSKKSPCSKLSNERPFKKHEPSLDHKHTCDTKNLPLSYHSKRHELEENQIRKKIRLSSSPNTKNTIKERTSNRYSFPTSTPKKDLIFPNLSEKKEFSFSESFQNMSNKNSNFNMTNSIVAENPQQNEIITEDECMDWDPVDASLQCCNDSIPIVQDQPPKKLPETVNIQDKGIDVIPTKSTSKSTQREEIPTELPQSKDTLPNLSTSKKIYIVTDTNIYLSKIDIIKTITQLPRNDIIIYVPYQVLRELDYIKDGRSNNSSKKALAIYAVNYISDKLNSTNERLQGQSVEDALENKVKLGGGDDSILSCCIQQTKNNHTVILLSEDKNLKNKALVSNIKVASCESILEVLKGIPIGEVEENLAVNGVVHEFELLCSYIIEQRMNGKSDNWNKIYGKPPWSLKRCLALFLKYWNVIAIEKPLGNFSEIGLPKQCKKTIEDFIEFLTYSQKIPQSNVKKFKEYVLNLALYLSEGFPMFEERVKSFTNFVISTNLCRDR